MNKEQQDLAWQGLTKEERQKIISVYACKYDSQKPYNEGYRDALRQLYGHHNLTSDTEPEEMLMVSRIEVQEAYKAVVSDMRRSVLFELFGDKCLPDKEPMRIDAADSLIVMAKDEMGITEKPKPKFKIGQKVILKLNGSIRKISSRKYTPKGFKYFFEGFDYADYSFEQGMEPYIEEKPPIVSKDNTKDDTKETMEVKELNLCELLKGHEGETFYFGEIDRNVTLKEIKKFKNGRGYLVVTYCNDNYLIRNDGKWYEYGDISLFPSKDQRDWNKWIEEQKPKVPKTWSEFVKNRADRLGATCDYGNVDCSFTEKDTPIEKAALTLLKIHQLIEVGYGGNVTEEENLKLKRKYTIVPFVNNQGIFEGFKVLGALYLDSKHVSFHTEEQAKEFLSRPENVQLLRDYFQIN